MEPLCECGHSSSQHVNDHPPICLMLGCECKGFKPKSIDQIEEELKIPCECKHPVLEHVLGHGVCTHSLCLCTRYRANQYLKAEPAPSKTFTETVNPRCKCGHSRGSHASVSSGDWCLMAGCDCMCFVEKVGMTAKEKDPLMENMEALAGIADDQDPPGTIRDEFSEEVDWAAVSHFFNMLMAKNEYDSDIEVTVKVPDLGVQLTVTLPHDRKDQFMKSLALYNARVEKL